MKLAITVWEDRVSPLCDTARSLLIAEVDQRGVRNEGRITIEADAPADRVSKLMSLGVDILICGAITESLSVLMKRHAIQVIPFVKGSVSSVLDAFSRQRLKQSEFQMPGCGSGRKRHFRRRLGNRRSRSQNLFNL